MIKWNGEYVTVTFKVQKKVLLELVRLIFASAIAAMSGVHLS